MQRILKFIRLNAHNRSILVKTYLLLTVIRLGLWLLPFEQLWKALLRLGQLRTSVPSIPSPAEAYKPMAYKALWAINTCCKLTPGGAKCLARALTLKVLLDRWGCPSTFRIGVLKNVAGQLEAHAWVEVEGQVIIGQLSNLEQYTLLPPLPTYQL